MTQSLTLSRPFDGMRQTASLARRRAAALCDAYPRETVAAALIGLITAAAIGATAISGSSSSDRPHASPPAPPAMVVRPIAADQALKVNAEIPVTAGPTPTAAP